LGATISFWREKTFQSIAVTMLTIALWLVFGEWIASGSIRAIDPQWANVVSPLRAVWDISQPIASNQILPWDVPIGNALLAGLFILMIGLCLMTLSIVMLRQWNPSKERRSTTPESVEPAMARSVSTQIDSTERIVKPWKSRAPRRVWNNPVLWREIRTWAYGRKVLLIRMAYLGIALLVGLGLSQSIDSGAALQSTSFQEELVPTAVSIVAPFLVLSLIIINALAVNSITNERDAGALDLLLVTEISPLNFLFGKLAGVLYVTKEMVIAPIVLCGFMWSQDAMTTENLIFTCIALMVMDLFVSMLGIHCGMIYSQSRVAIGTSLGTVFFLFLGVATCMLIMLMFRGSFGRQLAPFLFIILGGGTGLYLAIGSRNPSPAITISSFLLPFLTFFAITSFILRDQELTVFSVVSCSYAFATAAMMIPALSEFDFAFGRSRTVDED
jgi:ABC-type transport system involved in multi-copper enzyme maturation permease subunit